ncbi:MAG: sigma-70 family RNA polymerase sigma factor [Proteobacteria bacterium]|nr:sigma-70 family RNA polymerase sigma factor [Pseudomonadota bacterium]
MKGTWLASRMPAAHVESRASQELHLDTLYSQNAEFVWKSLARLGVRDADLPDMLQEVFVVAFRRRSSFDGSCKPSSWLFGICLRIASGYRRRAYNQRERAQHGTWPEQQSPEGDPERALEARQARKQLQRVLDAMPAAKRALFVMFEIDAMSCDQIAAILNVPVGTVYSRLHNARACFTRCLKRERVRGQRRRRP